MNRRRSAIRSLVSLFLLIAGAAAHAATRDAGGFEGVAFGTPRAETLDQVCRRLKIDKVQGFSGVDYRGPDDLRLVEEDEDIVVRGYRLDRLRTDAILLFNANQKFARVQYEAQKRPSGYFETTIKDDVVALSKSFQKMFGAPSFQMQPRLSEMRPGSRNYFWRWTRGRDTVYTAIVADEEDFGAVGVISDDALMREAPERRPEPEPVPAETPAAQDTFTAPAVAPAVEPPPENPTGEAIPAAPLEPAEPVEPAKPEVPAEPAGDAGGAGQTTVPTPASQFVPPLDAPVVAPAAH